MDCKIEVTFLSTVNISLVDSETPLVITLKNFHPEKVLPGFYKWTMQNHSLLN